MKRAICYPLKAGGSKSGNFELRHSLRSIEKNFEPDVPVFLLSAIRPKWLSDKVQFVRAEGYMEAMRAACEIAKEIVWMNDDIYLLKPTDWEYLRLWRRTEKQIGPKARRKLINSKNSWRNRLGRTLETCKEMGLEAFKYSSHTPYLYETEKLRETIERFDIGYKTAIETAYGNLWKVPVIQSGEKLRRYKDHAFDLDLSGKRFFNHNDNGLRAHSKGFLRGMFPNKSIFEAQTG